MTGTHKIYMGTNSDLGASMIAFDNGDNSFQLAAYAKNNDLYFRSYNSSTSSWNPWVSVAKQSQ